MPSRPRSAGPPPPRRGWRRTWIDDTVTVRASAAEAWTLLSDIDGWPAWTPGLAAITRKPGPLVAGRTRFAMHLRMAPLPTLRTPCRLYAHADGRIEWGGGIPGTAIRHRFEVRTLEGGGTEIRHVEYATNLLALVLRPFERAFHAHDARWTAAIVEQLGAA